ncbi:unnamed protein product, partial [Effrenium voratum]
QELARAPGGAARRGAPGCGHAPPMESEVRAADAEGHGCREALHAGDVGAPACRCSTVPATGRVLYCGYNNFSEHVPSSNIAAGKRELAVQEDVAKDEVLAARSGRGCGVYG